MIPNDKFMFIQKQIFRYHLIISRGETIATNFILYGKHKCRPFFLNCHFVCRFCEVTEKILSLRVISVNYLTVKDSGFVTLIGVFVMSSPNFFDVRIQS